MNVTVEEAIDNFIELVTAQKPGARQPISIRCFEYPFTILTPDPNKTRLTPLFGVELRPANLADYCEPIVATSERFSDAFGAALDELTLVFEAQYGLRLDLPKDRTFLQPNLPPPIDSGRKA